MNSLIYTVIRVCALLLCATVLYCGVSIIIGGIVKRRNEMEEEIWDAIQARLRR